MASATARIQDLESQLVIADATHREETARLVAELEEVYAENEDMRRELREMAGKGGMPAQGRVDGLVMGVERIEGAYRAELDSLTVANESLEAQLSGLDARLRSLTSTHALTVSRLRSAETSLATTQSHHAALKATHESLVQDHEILTDDHADLKDELAFLHAEKKGLKAQLSELPGRVQELESVEADLRDRFAKSCASRSELESQVATLQQSTTSLEDQLSALQGTYTSLVNSSETAHQTKLEAQFERLQSDLARDSAQESLRQLKVEKQTVDDRLEELEAQQTELEKQMEDSEVSRRDLETRVEQLQASQEESAAAVDKAQTDFAKSKAEIKALKTEKTGLQKRLKEVKKLETEMEQLSGTQERLQGEVEEERSQRRQSEAKLHVVEKENARMQTEIEAKVRRFDALSQDAERTAAELATGKAESSAAEQRFKTLQTEMAALRTTHQTEIKELEITTASLRRVNGSLTADLRRLKTESEAARKELVPLRLERDALKNECKKITSERNLLRHNLGAQRDGGQVIAGLANGVMTEADQRELQDAKQQLEKLAAERESSKHEIERLIEEREEFKRYCDWVRPDREKMKDELQRLRAEDAVVRSALKQSEEEKVLLMTEVRKYLAQQEVKAPPAPALPIGADLVVHLSNIEREFAKYRKRVETQLAEGKTEVARVEREKRLLDEQFGQFKEEQELFRVKIEKELQHTLEERRGVEEELKVCKVELLQKVFVKKEVPPLTPEIHANIAGFLAGENDFRSLASLSLVSRQVQYSTLPVLYETLVLDDEKNEDWAYGTRVDPTTPGLVLSSGWAHVKYLFMSLNHHDRIKTIIHAVHPHTVPFLSIAFPQLKFHMTYHMRKISLLDEPDRPPEYKRECALVIHRPVDAPVFHGILTTLPLRCWPVKQASPMKTGNAEVDSVESVDMAYEDGEPTAVAFLPKKEAECMRMGLVNGITDIRFLPNGRLLNRRKISPVNPYRHRLDSDLALRIDFVQDDATVQCTLYELSLLFKRTQPVKPVSIGSDTHMSLWCYDVPMRVYHALVHSLCRVLPDSLHDMHITVCLSRTETLSFPRIEEAFSVAVRVFSDLWRQILPERRDDMGKRNLLPMFHLIGFTHDDVKVNGTIRPRPGHRGSSFVADIQAKDWHDRSIYRSAIYPAVFPKVS